MGVSRMLWGREVSMGCEVESNCIVRSTKRVIYEREYSILDVQNNPF
jgi:hypothetical protein